MKIEELAKLCKEMRTAQRNYFRTRESTWLEQSKRLERQLDDAVNAIFNPPEPTLFDEK